MLEKNIRLGMISIFTPQTLQKEEAYIGKIIYIHPKKYFYTVELELGNGYKVRECFDFPRKKTRILPPDRSRMPI